MMEASSRIALLRLILWGLLLLFLKASLDLYHQLRDIGVNFHLSSQTWLIFLCLTLLSLLTFIALVLTWKHLRKPMLTFASWIIQHLPSSRPVVISIIVALVACFSLAVLFPWSELIDVDAFRWLASGIVIIVVTLLLRRLLPLTNWLNLLAIAGLIIGGVYRFCQFLPDISMYPFSIGWSEASRYYYASLYFSNNIYGFSVSPSTLHPTRYLMQSIPFIIDWLPLWFHRFWQVLLWLVTLLGTGILLGRRLKIILKSLRWLLLVWVFLFLWQGPVYYHLLIMVIIVLWGFNYQRTWLAMLVVILASIWAGISRVNWFPVPGMLAATIYFIEKPLSWGEDIGNKNDGVNYKKQSIHSTIGYLVLPIIWVVVGTLTALGSQSIYIILSDNKPEQFASSFSSDLLWYRLLPNSTFSLGILTATILISLPILILAVYRYRKGDIHFHPVVLLGLITILGVLLIGGLVVSVKIGGGSNLHNMDAYLVILMIVGGYIYFHRVPLGSSLRTTQPQISAWVNLFLVVIPVLFTLKSDSQFVRYNPSETKNTLTKIQRNIHRVLEDDGEVLFISERQLLIFDYIDSVTLVPEYEKVFLMEMVMAGNQAYLGDLRSDIQNQRFDLIITDPLFDRYQESGERWAEENNVWVELVSTPILCHYWRRVTFPESGIQILSPRDNRIDCEFALDSNFQE